MGTWARLFYLFVNNTKPTQTMTIEQAVQDNVVRQAITDSGVEFRRLCDAPDSPQAHVWQVVLDNCPCLAKVAGLYDWANQELQPNGTIINTVKAMLDEAKGRCDDSAYLATLELIKIYLPLTWKAVQRLSTLENQKAIPVVDSVVFTPAKQGIDLLSADKDRAQCIMSDGSTYEFSWWGDEITFTEDELIGLTVKEIGELYSKKDISYLQS